MESGMLERVFAFIIDAIIILAVTTILTYWMPLSETYKKEIENIKEANEKVNNNEMNIEEQRKVYEKATYVANKETIAQSAVEIVVLLAYYVSFAYYKNGQTVGKMINKIKIVDSNNKTPSFFKLLLRAGIINFIFFNFIALVTVLFLNQNHYMKLFNITNYISALLVLTSFFLITLRKDKRGVHDILSDTKVVKV